MAAASSKPASGSAAPVRPEPELSGWVVFAATMLLIAGVFNVFYGLAAILNDDVVTVGGRGVILWDFTTWGWVHLIIGALMNTVALGLFAMRGWARWTAVAIAALAAILQVGMITAFPLWSLLMVTLDVIVIYQLTARWDAQFGR